MEYALPIKCTESNHQEASVLYLSLEILTIFLGILRLLQTDARGILEIARRAKGRFNEQDKGRRQDFLIGLHSPLEAPPLAPVLSLLRQEVTGLNPIFRIVPFVHLYKQLAEGGLDVVLSFAEDELTRRFIDLMCHHS